MLRSSPYWLRVQFPKELAGVPGATPNRHPIPWDALPKRKLVSWWQETSRRFNRGEIAENWGPTQNGMLNSNIDLKLKPVHRLPGKTILSTSMPPTFECKILQSHDASKSPNPRAFLWILGSQITPVSIPCRLWMGRQVRVSKDQLRPRK